MDRKAFIQSRLQEALVEPEEYEQEVDLDAVVDELEEMDDEELIALGAELGVFDDGDIEELDARINEDVEEDDDEVEQALLDDVELEEEVAGYIEALEERLEEATELIAGLTQALEEGEEGDGQLALKYEAALGIIQETATHYQLLQEAVGGEENANKLVEAHIAKLEKGVVSETGTHYTPMTEDFDVETLLSEASIGDSTMLRNKRLAESALSKLGMN